MFCWYPPRAEARLTVRSRGQSLGSAASRRPSAPFPVLAIHGALWLLGMVGISGPASARGGAGPPDPPTPPVEMVPGDLLDPVERERLLHAPDGETSDLARWAGPSGLMVVFASNTCPYVLDWLDRFPRLASLGAEHGVGFVVVNSNARKRGAEDSPEAMAELARSRGFDFPYLVDPESALAQALGARRTPEVFLFDDAWRLVYHGAIDDHSGPWEQVESHWALDALGQMAVGEEPTVGSTQALGCAVLGPRRRRPTH